LNHTFVQLATLMDSAISIADAASFRHIGSVGWKIASGAIFWSKEAYRVPDIDRGEKATIDLLLQRLHPDDRAILQARGGSSVEARQALVVVRGSGIGLEPAASARLFTPFFATRDGGMGMVSRSAARSSKCTEDGYGPCPTTDRRRPSASPCRFRRRTQREPGLRRRRRSLDT